ncbi:hypothetical protein GLW20_04535 [Virgibacillus halodenitrificans]|nr:hypothetical protein [Virgibacillus halodenitrificans]
MKHIALIISSILCALVAFLNFSNDAYVYGTVMVIFSLLALAEFVKQLINRSHTQS